MTAACVSCGMGEPVARDGRGLCRQCRVAYAMGRREALQEALDAALRVRGGRCAQDSDEHALGSFSASSALVRFVRGRLRRKYPVRERRKRWTVTLTKLEWISGPRDQMEERMERRGQARRVVLAEDIRRLRDEAGRAGDLAQVEVCDRALDEADGSPEGYAAWAECERVILNARKDGLPSRWADWEGFARRYAATFIRWAEPVPVSPSEERYAVMRSDERPGAYVVWARVSPNPDVYFERSQGGFFDIPEEGKEAVAWATEAALAHKQTRAWY